jgi:hypothetical protein
MDMKDGFSRHFHRRKRKKADTAQLAAQLAPLEELDNRVAVKQAGVSQTGDPQAGPQNGAIVVDAGSLSLPKDIMEESPRPWKIEPVVIVIISLMLVFIAFIAWQISLLPEP